MKHIDSLKKCQTHWTLPSIRVRITWAYLVLSSYGKMVGGQCCQVLTSIHGHIRQKLRPFSKISRPPIKKFVLHDISKHNNNKKQKNIMFVEVFCHFFFISALHFWMKQYTNFQNLTKFLSQHLVATHGHFHRHQFLTANYFFIRPDLSYLAVATATWQHCWGGGGLVVKRQQR